MCLALLSQGKIPHWPIFVAANRDEYYSRPSAPPSVERGGRVAWLGPRDLRAGGTWLGVNERGIFAVITNRNDAPAPQRAGARSRGLVVREVLESARAVEARQRIESFVHDSATPFQMLFGDRENVVLVEHTPSRGTAFTRLEPGVHIVSNLGARNDRAIGEVRRAFDAWEAGEARGIDPWERAAALLRIEDDGPGSPAICKIGVDRGTISSALFGIGDHGEVRFLFADGPPARAEYREYPFAIAGRS